MNGGIGVSGRALSIGIGILVVVGIGAGIGGYQLGLRAPRAGALAATNLAANSSPAPGQHAVPSPSSIASPGVNGTSPSATPVSPDSGLGPAPRGNPSWVYDAATGKFLLYGGNRTTGSWGNPLDPLGDTWSWDGTAWTRVAAAGPPPRSGAQVAYDESRKAVLLFGGLTGESDTWTWDGTRWLQMGPDQSPPASGTPVMAFDSAHATALLVFDDQFHGAVPAQTWKWDGRTWSQVKVSPQPLAGSQMALAYDPVRGTMLLFTHLVNGGQQMTWVFDGTAWTQLGTTSGTSSLKFAMARDDANSDVVLFGSNGDTWTWDGSKWSPANPVHSPGPRWGMAMTYDSSRHQVVLFGGESGPAADIQHHNDIWTWNGTDWTQVHGG